MAAKRKTKKKTKKVSVVDEVKGTIKYAIDLGRANASKFFVTQEIANGSPITSV